MKKKFKCQHCFKLPGCILVEKQLSDRKEGFIICGKCLVNLSTRDKDFFIIKEPWAFWED
jgi:hypothetical protein